MFSRILPRGGRLELLRNKAGYIIYSTRKIRAIPNSRCSSPIIIQVQNLNIPRFGFNIGVSGILLSVSLSLCFLTYLTKCLLSHYTVTFVSLLNIIAQLFILVIIKVLNHLILFILMYGVLLLILISPAQNGLFPLLMTVPGLHGYFS